MTKKYEDQNKKKLILEGQGIFSWILPGVPLETSNEIPSDNPSFISRVIPLLISPGAIPLQVFLQIHFGISPIYFKDFCNDFSFGHVENFSLDIFLVNSPEFGYCLV